MEIFVISGYWKDDGTEFNDYFVAEATGDEVVDYFFFYDMNEEEIKDAIALGEDTEHDFVITSYRKEEV